MAALNRPDFDIIKEIYDAFKASPSQGIPASNAALQLPIPLLLGLSILNVSRAAKSLPMYHTGKS